MADAQNLYRQAVNISAEYLGPTAERFISRQIITHLDKAPEKLNRKDIPKLTEWVRLTFALLTDDSELVESFAADLEALAHTTKKSRVGDG